jgi:hypothetical protein
MPPFVAKFCPVKFDWDNALMLNCMQWAVESEPERTKWPFKSADVSLYELEGTVEDADLLSLHFTLQKGFIKETIVSYDTRMDAALRMEFQQIFALRFSVSCFDASIVVTNAVTHLRANLRRMFSSSVEPKNLPFSAVFSPVQYGWRDAYMLNWLLWVYGTVSPWRALRITKITGTQADAHWLSYLFCSHIHTLICQFSHVSKGAELRAAFSSGGGDFYDVKQALARLRISLYSTPRSTAFMMGKHRRLGGGGVAVLPDEVCHLILALSVELLV